jgi:hypothetical protein
MERQYIGVMEAVMSFGKAVQDKGVQTKDLNLHVLFSMNKTTMIAHCLDFNLRTGIDIREAIKGRLKDDPIRIAYDLIRDVNRDLVNMLVHHVITSAASRIEFLEVHADDESWNEFRNIRMERDNHVLKEFFGYTGINDSYLSLPVTLAREIDKLSGESSKDGYFSDGMSITSLHVRNSLVKVISEQIAA